MGDACPHCSGEPTHQQRVHVLCGPDRLESWRGIHADRRGIATYIFVGCVKVAHYHPWHEGPASKVENAVSGLANSRRLRADR